MLPTAYKRRSIDDNDDISGSFNELLSALERGRLTGRSGLDERVMPLIGRIGAERPNS